MHVFVTGGTGHAGSHIACGTGAMVKGSVVGTTGRRKCTVPAGDTVVLRPHDAELAASV